VRHRGLQHLCTVGDIDVDGPVRHLGQSRLRLVHARHGNQHAVAMGVLNLDVTPLCGDNPAPRHRYLKALWLWQDTQGLGVDGFTLATKHQRGVPLICGHGLALHLIRAHGRFRCDRVPPFGAQKVGARAQAHGLSGSDARQGSSPQDQQETVHALQVDPQGCFRLRKDEVEQLAISRNCESAFNFMACVLSLTAIRPVMFISRRAVDFG